MELYRTAESIKKRCYCLHKHINCQRCGEPRISQINILDVSAAGSHPAALKQQIRANGETTRERMNSGREIQTCRANTDGRMLQEIVLRGGWWGGEEVDKAETSDILKRYTTKVIHFLSIMWEIQSGSTFP